MFYGCVDTCFYCTVLDCMVLFLCTLDFLHYNKELSFLFFKEFLLQKNVKKNIIKNHKLPESGVLKVINNKVFLLCMMNVYVVV